MTSTDWHAIRADYVKGQISLRELSEKYEFADPSPVLHRAASEHWTREREQYRIELASKTIEQAQKRELSARDMLAQAVESAFDAFLALPVRERGRVYADLQKQYSAMVGETTERSAIVDGREDLGAFTEEDRKVIEQLAERVAADELGRG